MEESPRHIAETGEEKIANIRYKETLVGNRLTRHLLLIDNQLLFNDYENRVCLVIYVYSSWNVDAKLFIINDGSQ